MRRWTRSRKASGTSKALIYEHFESKHAMHETLLAEHAGELFRRFAANAARATTGEDRLRGGVDAFFGWVQERPVAWRALFRDSADPELAPMIDRLQERAGEAVRAWVRPDADGADDLASRWTPSWSPAPARRWPTGGPSTPTCPARSSSSACCRSAGQGLGQAAERWAA